jgi:hypothetical protein
VAWFEADAASNRLRWTVLPRVAVPSKDADGSAAMGDGSAAEDALGEEGVTVSEVALDTVRRVALAAPVAVSSDAVVSVSPASVVAAPFAFVVDGDRWRAVLQAPSAAELGMWMSVLRDSVVRCAPALPLRDALLFHAASSNDATKIARLLGWHAAADSDDGAAAADDDDASDVEAVWDRTRACRHALSLRDGNGDSLVLCAARHGSARVLALLLRRVLPWLAAARARVSSRGRVAASLSAAEGASADVAAAFDDVNLDGAGVLHLAVLSGVAR